MSRVNTALSADQLPAVLARARYYPTVVSCRVVGLLAAMQLETINH